MPQKIKGEINLKGKILSVLLALCIIISVVPMFTFSASADTGYVARVTDSSGNPVNAVDSKTSETIDTDGKFETLQAAIDVVPKNNTNHTITMLADYSAEGMRLGTVASGQKITLDIAGKTLKLFVNASGSYSYVIYNAGDLTVMDSTDTDCNGESDGSITNEVMKGVYPGGYGGDWNKYNYGTEIIGNYNKLTVNSGHLNNCADGGICFAIDNYNTLTINGGKINTYSANTIRSYGNGTEQTINVNGGEIQCLEADSSGIWLQINDTKNVINVNITDGTIIGEGDLGYNIYETVASGATPKNVTYNITGGTFKGPSSMISYGANITITGGIFEGKVNIKHTCPDTRLYVSGGTFHKQFRSYGTYKRNKYIYGGRFKNFPNYDTSQTFYFDDDDMAYIKYTTFCQLNEDSTNKYKTYREYEDAGYYLYAAGSFYGYLVDENGTWLTDGGDYICPKVTQYDVYKENGHNDFEFVESIYAIKKDVYNLTEEEKDDYLYTKGCEMWEKKFYYLSCYAAAETLELYPHNTPKSSGWCQLFVDNKTLAESLAYSASYVKGPYSVATMAGWTNYLPSTASCNLKNYWMKIYKSEYKGIFVDENTGKQYKTYTFYDKTDVTAIADGFTDKPVENETDYSDYYDVVPWELDLGKAEVISEESNTKILVKSQEIQIDLTNGTASSGNDDISFDQAADLISSTLNNTEISGFLDTNINTAASLEDVKTALKAKTNSDAAANSNIDALPTEDVDRTVKVNLTSAVVSDTKAAAETTTVTTATFDVKPVAEVAVKNNKGIETRYDTVIGNEYIKSPITFRLPVNSNVAAPSVTVYHKDTKPNLGESYGDNIGFYAIQTSPNGKKFIELEADNFSFYTYVLHDIPNNSTVLIIDELDNTRGYTSLADAVEDYKSDGNADDCVIVLMKDSESVDFGDKELKLELNGYKLTGTSENATKVTISNENEIKNTLEAVGTYANDVSEFPGGGYSVKPGDNKTIICTLPEDLQTAKYRVNLTLNEFIALNMTVANKDGKSLSKDTLEKFVVKVKSFEKNATETAITPDDNGKYLLFEYDPVYLDSNITINFYYDGELYKTLKFSPEKYCNAVKKQLASDTPLNVLCSALMNYGGYCQQQFMEKAYQTIATTAPSTPNSTYSECYKDDLGNSDGDVLPFTISASLNLQSATKIRFIITPTNPNMTLTQFKNTYKVILDKSFKGKTFYDSDITDQVKNVKINEETGDFYIDTVGINSSNLSAFWSISIVNGADQITHYYSPMTYSYANSGENLANALYDYAKAACEYFGTDFGGKELL